MTPGPGPPRTWWGFLSEEQGYTLIELAMSLILSSMIVASLVAVMYSFSQSASDTGRNADLQQTARSLVADLVVELRQAEAVSDNGYAIESLSADRIVFYTDRVESPGPERVVYHRRDCVDGLCELWVTQYPAVVGSGPHWEFETTPIEDAFVLGRVSNTEPLFRGADWVGEPPAKTYVGDCGGTGPECDFPLVSIVFQANPTGTSSGADRTFEIEEEVRLRNE